MVLLDRLKRYWMRAAWAVVDQGSLPLSQLVLTPLLLARLGRPGFGLWALCLTIISMSPLLSLGAGMATTKHVAADLAAEDRSSAIRTIRAALTIACGCGLLATLAAAYLAPAAAAALFGQMGPPAVTARVLLWSGIVAAIQEVDSVFAGALRGAERFDAGAQIEVAGRAAMVLLLGVLAARSPTASAMLEGLTGVVACKAVAKAWRVAALLGSARCCLPTFAAAPIRRVLRFGAWHWLQTAGTVSFGAADQLLVGGLFGGVALAGYSACLQLSQVVHVLPSVMLQVVFPRVSALGASLDARRGNEILRSATLLAFGVAGALALALALFGSDLLRLWVGAAFAAENARLLLVLVLAHLLLSLNIGGYFVLLGSGRPAVSARVVLLAGACQTLTAIVLAQFGLVALACSRFVYALITSSLYRLARYPTRDE